MRRSDLPLCANKRQQIALFESPRRRGRASRTAGQGLIDVYTDCMADRGYLRRPMPE